MTHDYSGGLPPDLQKLLRAEREAPPPPPEVKARVLARVEQTLAGASAGAPAAGAATTWTGPTLALLVAAAVAAGLWLTRPDDSQRTPERPDDHASLIEPAAPPAILEPTPAPARTQQPEATTRPAPTPQAAPTATSQPTPPAPAPTPAVKRRAAATEIATGRRTALARASIPVAHAAAVTHRPSREDRLSVERALLLDARRALYSGDTTVALRLLRRHASRFPRGRYVPERQSLRVQALARAGQAEEARRAAHDFLSRYPSSIHRPAVLQAVGGLEMDMDMDMDMDSDGE